MKSISTLIGFPHFHIIGFPHFYITVVQAVWQVVAHPLLPMSGSHFSQGWLGSLFTSQIISSQAPRPTLSENLTMTVNIALLNIHFHLHFSTFLCILHSISQDNLMERTVVLWTPFFHKNFLTPSLPAWNILFCRK